MYASRRGKPTSNKFHEQKISKQQVPWTKSVSRGEKSIYNFQNEKNPPLELILGPIDYGPPVKLDARASSYWTTRTPLELVGRAADGIDC